MQNVPKKLHKKRKKWLVPVLLLTAAIICAAAAVLLNRFSSAPLPQNTAENQKTIFDREQEQLVSITITPASGESYSLDYQGGTLVLRDDPAYSLRSSARESLLSCAVSVVAQETLLDTATQPVSLDAYGLSPARASGVFTYSDGTQLTLSVGDPLPVENTEYYFTVSGDSNIYAVSGDIYDTLTTEFYELHTVNNPSIQSDLIDRITISGDLNFSAYYTKSGWIMDSPYRYPLAADKMDTFLTNLDSLRFSTWVDYAANVSLKDYGLETPRRTLTLDFAASTLTVPDEDGAEHTYDIPASHITIAMGDFKSDMIFYALYGKEVMTATTFTFGFIQNFSVEKMLLQNPVNFASNNLSRVVLERGGVTADYSVRLVERIKANNDFETDEYGNIIYDVTAVRNGSQVDSTTFLRWYQALTGLLPAGRLPDGWTPQSEAQARIVIVNAAGDLTREIVFYPYNQVYQAVALDGVCLYYFRNTWYEQLGELP